MNIASDRKNIADWVQYYVDQADWFVKQQLDFPHEADIGSRMEFFSLMAKSDLKKANLVADGLFLEAWEKSERIENSTHYKDSLILALTSNAALALFYEIEKNDSKLSLAFAMQASQIFGMLVGASNLWLYGLNAIRQSSSLMGKRSRELRKHTPKGKAEAAEIEIIRQKYFEYMKAGTFKSAAWLAKIVQPLCSELTCSEQVIARWIRGYTDTTTGKKIVGWRDEYATTQLAK